MGTLDRQMYEYTYVNSSISLNCQGMGLKSLGSICRVQTRSNTEDVKIKRNVSKNVPGN